MAQLTIQLRLTRRMSASQKNPNKTPCSRHDSHGWRPTGTLCRAGPSAPEPPGQECGERLLRSSPAVRRHRRASAFSQCLVRGRRQAEARWESPGRWTGGPGAWGRPSTDPAWIYNCVSRDVQHQWGPRTQRGAAGASSHSWLSCAHQRH